MVKGGLEEGLVEGVVGVVIFEGFSGKGIRHNCLTNFGYKFHTVQTVELT